MIIVVDFILLLLLVLCITLGGNKTSPRQGLSARDVHPDFRVGCLRLLQRFFAACLTNQRRPLVKPRNNCAESWTLVWIQHDSVRAQRDCCRSLQGIMKEDKENTRPREKKVEIKCDENDRQEKPNKEKKETMTKVVSQQASWLRSSYKCVIKSAAGILSFSVL